MAKINPRQLFVDAFKTFNLTRYANSRVDKPRFQGLQLGEITFGKTSRTGLGDGEIMKYKTLSSDSRRFTAIDQSFIRANIGDKGISNVLSTDYPYEDITTMKALSEPGLAAYMETDLSKVLVGVVFSEANSGTLEDVTNEVKLILMEACNYTLEENQITVLETDPPSNVWNVNIDCETIRGEIIAVRSEMPVLNIPVTDYGPLSEEIEVPNPYPPTDPLPEPQ